jgi:hypothetical protein
LAYLFFVDSSYLSGSTDHNAPSLDKQRSEDKSSIKTAVIAVEGPDKEACAAARGAIVDICSKGYSTLLEEPGFVEMTLSVPEASVPSLIGHSGSTVRALRDAFPRVHIYFPQRSHTKGSNTKGRGVVNSGCTGSQQQVGALVVVKVAGPRDQCIALKAEIGELLKYYHCAATHPGMVSHPNHRREVPRKWPVLPEPIDVLNQNPSLIFCF